jgi:hypothetical protein
LQYYIQVLCDQSVLLSLSNPMSCPACGSYLKPVAMKSDVDNENHVSYPLIYLVPIPVATRSKVWVCGRSLAGIVGSNPTRAMDVCLLQVLCVVE